MNNYLPTDYQNFIALSRYARWNDEEQRRETWLETVDRYFDYMDNHLKTKNDYTITKALKEKMTDAIDIKTTEGRGKGKGRGRGKG